MLQWSGNRCVFCPMQQLRPLSPADGLSQTRRGMAHTKLTDWTVTVLSHYYGPVQYKHVAVLCCACETLYFHNFLVPGPTRCSHLRMELAGRLQDFMCLQTGFTTVAFSLDFIRHFECLLMHNQVTYQGFLRSYAAFWKCDALATPRTTELFVRAHLLYALLDFLQRGGLLRTVTCSRCEIFA